MGISFLPEERGMWFAMPTRQNHSFWMKGVLIPLDMIFVDEDAKVVGILEDVPPLSTAARSVGRPSRYVLEVNAGWARRHNVKVGDTVTSMHPNQRAAVGAPHFQLRDPSMANSPNAYPNGEWRYQIVGQSKWATPLTGLFLVGSIGLAYFLYTTWPVTSKR